MGLAVEKKARQGANHSHTEVWRGFATPLAFIFGVKTAVMNKSVFPSHQMRAANAVRVAPLGIADHGQWEELARGYKLFYRTPTSDAEFELAWRRLLGQDGVYGLGGYIDGKMALLSCVSQ